MRYSRFQSNSQKMSWSELMVKRQKQTGFKLERETVERRDEIIKKYATLLSISASYVES